jgi:putative endonuclease
VQRRAVLYRLDRDLNKRLEAHNQGKVRTTKNRRPVRLVYTEEFEDYSEARSRELYLKSGTGRDWLKNKLEGWPSGCPTRRIRRGEKAVLVLVWEQALYMCLDAVTDGFIQARLGT